MMILLSQICRVGRCVAYTLFTPISLLINSARAARKNSNYSNSNQKNGGYIPDSGGFKQSSGHTFFVFLNKIPEFFTELSSRTENVKNRDQVSASGWHHHLLTVVTTRLLYAVEVCQSVTKERGAGRQSSVLQPKYLRLIIYSGCENPPPSFDIFSASARRCQRCTRNWKLMRRLEIRKMSKSLHQIRVISIRSQGWIWVNLARHSALRYY